MTTPLYSEQADASFPVNFPNSGSPGVVYGSYEVTDAPTLNDVIKLCKLPAGAVVTGGALYCDALESNATPTLSVQLGTAATPTLYVATAAFAQSTRVVQSVYGNTNFGGFTPVGFETDVQLKFSAVAATFTTGTVACAIYYVIPLNA